MRVHRDEVLLSVVAVELRPVVTFPGPLSDAAVYEDETEDEYCSLVVGDDRIQHLLLGHPNPIQCDPVRAWLSVTAAARLRCAARDELGRRRKAPLDDLGDEPPSSSTSRRRCSSSSAADQHCTVMYKPVQSAAMASMSVSEARSALPAVLDRVLAGEEVTIAARPARRCARSARRLRSRRADAAFAAAERLRGAHGEHRGKPLPRPSVKSRVRRGAHRRDPRRARRSLDGRSRLGRHHLCGIDDHPLGERIRVLFASCEPLLGSVLLLPEECSRNPQRDGATDDLLVYAGLLEERIRAFGRPIEQSLSSRLHSPRRTDSAPPMRSTSRQR